MPAWVQMEWCPGPVRVLSNEGDVFAFSHELKPKFVELPKETTQASCASARNA